MEITKIGHCCLVIEEKGKRIMTDPGRFTVGDHELEHIDIILITHEHADHLHTDSLKDLLTKNPQVQIFTNSSVGALLDEADIPHELLEGTALKEILGLTIEAFDAKHAEIFEEFGQVQNTGYVINNRLFYPGDAYAELGRPIEILALPVGGPWCRMTDTLHYAIRMAPRHVFPVHDGVEREDRVNIVHNIAETILGEQNIHFVSMKGGDSVVL